MSFQPPADDEDLAKALKESRRLLDAPDAVLQRAIQLFDAQARPVATAEPAAASAPGRWRRLVASLSFDSATLSPTTLGLRATTSKTRQLLYAADGRDVDLRVETSVDGLSFVISGQVLGPDEAGVTELRCAEEAYIATWNDLCEFRFGPVGPGPCTLTLRAADWELELPTLRAGAQE
jgi:hypothetical protein